MEIDNSGRPHGPNKTTEIIATAITYGLEGHNLQDIIDMTQQRHIASASHTGNVISNMACLEVDGLKHCRPNDCVFGEIGNRTYCLNLEEGTQPKETEVANKLLFLPPEYIRIASGFYNPIFRERLMWEAINIFEQNGYQVAEQDNFDMDNPHHLGFFYEDSALNLDTRINDILEENNIGIVPNVDFESSETVFAKHRYSDKGRFKFLIETEEQKAKLKAWLVLTREIDKEYLLDLTFPDFIDELDGLVDYFTQNPDKFDKSLLNDWQFQKFIEPTQGYLSKIRAISDMYGNISYAYTRIQPTSIDGKVPILKKTSKNHPLRLAYMNRETIAYNDIGEALLTDPLSPMFLNTKDMVTNSQKQGYSISLNGQNRLLPQEIRRYLEHQNIDPDYPLVPINIARATSQIGQTYRSLWPYCAPDFMFDDKTNKYYYLETNLLPELFANDVPGGKIGMKRTELHKLFMTQIASTNSKYANAPRLFPHLDGGNIIL
jgi:hypothetical protein